MSGGRRCWALTATVALVAALAGPAVHRPVAAAEVTFEQRMLELVNRERVANGLQPVVANAILAAAASDAPYLGCPFPVSGRATDMGVRNYFSHAILGCNNQSVLHLLNATGLLYSGAGENIAWVNAITDPLVAAENLHSQLMSSDMHRANILNPKFTSVGIGSWRTAPGQTWSGAGFPLPNVFIAVQIFAGLPLGLDLTLGPEPTTPTTPAGRFTPLSPARILDTRTGLGGQKPIGPGATAELQVTGRGGVPASGVGAVAMNVAVVQPTASGYLTLYPGGTARPLAANLNFAAGETVSNLVVVKTGANGTVAIHNPAGTTHVIADVAGWYSESAAANEGRLEPLSPTRLLDTRTGLGGAARLGPGGSLELQVAGRAGVPSTGAQAAILNVTVTGTTAPSYLTVHPTGEARPNASNVNFAAGDTVANRVMVKLGSSGRVTIFNGAGSADVIVDVGGWYTDASVSGALGAFIPLVPSRVLDTRDGTGGAGGLVGAGATRSVQITGRGGVPSSGARAVILNATVTGTGAAGYLTVFPSGTSRPTASDLNFAAGDTRANLVVAKLSSGGQLTIFSSAATHVIFDVAGWIS